MEHAGEYAGLFAASFLAATVLPFQSEVILFGMLITEHFQTWLLVLVASVGNVLGSCVNWLLGLFVARFEDRPWFPVRREKIARAERWYHQYGRWSLLLSWAPIIGDPPRRSRAACRALAARPTKTHMKVYPDRHAY